MLTSMQIARRPMIALISAAAVILSGLMLTAQPAAAEQDCTYVDFVLTCTETTPGGEDGQPGDNGGDDAEPTCDLDSLAPSEFDTNRTPNFCMGTEVCYTADLLPPVALPEGDKPNEDSVARGTFCYNGFSRRVAETFWSDDERPPTLLEQVRTAVDALEFATPNVGVSPTGRTLVNLDTWFWLDGVQREVSASAFTVTATATLRSMTVDPGDGSAPFACDNIATTAAQAEQSCVHRYRKASRQGSTTVDGRPAFQATVTTVYDLAFTSGGNPIGALPGAPTTIDGPPSTTAIRVDEVQTLSRPSR